MALSKAQEMQAERLVTRLASDALSKIDASGAGPGLKAYACSKLAHRFMLEAGLFIADAIVRQEEKSS